MIIPENTQNRDHLQALTLAELMQEAHDMYQRQPDRFLSPDRAWQWLRLTIEPMSFDIRSENTLAGRQYVGYWAGEPITSLDMYDRNGVSQYDAIARLMADFFDATYPPTLSGSRWCITHVALPMEVN